MSVEEEVSVEEEWVVEEEVVEAMDGWAKEPNVRATEPHHLCLCY